MTKGRFHKDFLSGYLDFVFNTEPSDLFKKWTCFSLVAAALRRKVWITWQEKIYPNLYVLLVGPPAARKGAAMTPALSLLRDLGVPLASDCSTRAALVTELKNSFSGLETGANGVVTPHSSLSIFNKELVNLLGYGNRELLGDLCQFYDCEPRWKKKTTTQGTWDITNLWLNLIGAITPRLLRQSCPVELVGGGFISRCCSIYSEKPGKIVQTPPFKKIDGKWTYVGDPGSEENSERKAIIHDLGMISLLSGEFKLDESWIETWIKWYNGVDNDIKLFHDTPLEEYIGRRQVHAQKLSMILSACRGDEMVVTGEDLKRAIAFLEEAEEFMLEVFSGFEGGDLGEATNKLMKLLGRYGTAHWTVLYKHFIKEIKREEFISLLNNLKAINFASENNGIWTHIQKEKQNENFRTNATE